MEIHDASNLFPIDEDTIPDLAEDIRRHGLLEPVKMSDGKVIDGRRRLRACSLAGVEPRFENVATNDPIAYAWSLNGPRRHLTPSQKAMVGARMREAYEKEAKARKSEGGSAAGRGRPKKVPENFPEPIPDLGDARDKVGDVVGVSGKTIDHATTVLSQGVPELIEAVEKGRMAVSAAAALSEEDEEVQRAKVKERGERKAANGGRKKVKPPKPPANEARDEKPEPTAGSCAADDARAVGCHWANEAINCLTRIPKTDAQRAMAMKIVKDWIKHNQ